jgi:uncharacterized membrane protein YdjX (TVP38/TMEM64 family)
MRPVLRKLWPLVIGLLIFAGVSVLVRTQLGAFAGMLEGSSLLYGMALYVLLGIATVMIPFGSLVPFMPAAVSMWGWPLTAALTIIAWVAGSQIIFEGARRFGKPFVAKLVPPAKLKRIGKMTEHKSLPRQIVLRWIVRGDILSYAFGLFTAVSRRDFFIITLAGVTPGALTYSYFGSLPLAYQLGIAGLGVTCLAAYWAIEAMRPEWLKTMRLETAPTV